MIYFLCQNSDAYETTLSDGTEVAVIVYDRTKWFGLADSVAQPNHQGLAEPNLCRANRSFEFTRAMEKDVDFIKTSGEISFKIS